MVLAAQPAARPARVIRWLLALALGAWLAPAVAAAPQIESLRLQRGGEAWAFAPGSRVLQLQADDRDFRVRLQRPLGPGAGPVRYRFWLQGHDPGWMEPDPAGERRFRRLDPGNYRLRSAVMHASGHWVEAAPVLVLVDPPAWHRPGAIAAALAGALLLAGGFALSWRRRQRRRETWQLAQLRRELAEQHSAAKSRFLASLGHEIRTPMTGVLGMAELLHGSGLDPVQQSRVDAIRRAGEHLLRLVNDALDLARIEAGRLELELEPFALPQLLQEVSALLRPLAQAKGLAFTLSCEPGLPACLRGDATRLRQILFNLGHNAVKFCDRGEVALHVGPREPQGLVLTVCDSGPGMGQEQLARLFRRFEPGPCTGGSGGSGLGLAICRELAVAMGGSIAVHSQPGQGSRFRVELPLAAASPPALAASPAPAAVGALRLLLVEDDAVVADVLAALLRRQGHEVRHVAHGLAALAELDCATYDLALLDLDLPGMDGITLAGLLRGRGHRLPLLAVTARADAAAEPEARAAGMDGFLRKPASGEMLAAAIARLAPPPGVRPAGG